MVQVQGKLSSRLEKIIEKKLNSSIRSECGLCIKLTPPPRGIPDRLVLLPGGYVAMVELKRPEGGIISPAQEEMLKTIKGLGVPTFVISCEYDIEDLLQQYRAYLYNNA